MKHVWIATLMFLSPAAAEGQQTCAQKQRECEAKCAASADKKCAEELRACQTKRALTEADVRAYTEKARAQVDQARAQIERELAHANEHRSKVEVEALRAAQAQLARAAQADFAVVQGTYREAQEMAQEQKHLAKSLAKLGRLGRVVEPKELGEGQKQLAESLAQLGYIGRVVEPADLANVSASLGDLAYLAAAAPSCDLEQRIRALERRLGVRGGQRGSLEDRVAELERLAEMRDDEAPARGSSRDRTSKADSDDDEDEMEDADDSDEMGEASGGDDEDDADEDEPNEMDEEEEMDEDEGTSAPRSPTVSKSRGGLYPLMVPRVLLTPQAVQAPRVHVRGARPFTATVATPAPPTLVPMPPTPALAPRPPTPAIAPRAARSADSAAERRAEVDELMARMRDEMERLQQEMNRLREEIRQPRHGAR